MARKQPSVRIDDRELVRMINRSDEDAERWLDGVAESIVGDIVLSFGTSPPGRTYSRGGGRTHTASQAGNPPNVDYGILRASIEWERDGRKRRKIMDGVEYGIHLEDGTETIAPRPFIEPVFRAWEEKIGDDARRHLGIED